MDWEYVVHHLISGCPLVIVVVLFYSCALRIMGRKQSAGHVIGSLIFCFYLTGILVMTGICSKGSFSPSIVYIPFADMIRGPAGTVLNVLLFVPMGIFLPLLYKQYDRMSRTALTGFLISLSVEAIQMFGLGTTDINDLITNTVGTCLGYIIYRMLRMSIPDPVIKQIRIKGSLSRTEPVFFWIVSLMIMMYIQPLIYHFIYK